jgi:hypothetical protein
MKTPIQQLIAQMEQKIADRKIKAKAQSKKEKDFLQEEIYAIRECIESAVALLPTEREVIEEAYDEGREDGVENIVKISDYFTTKFNDNEHTKS